MTINKLNNCKDDAAKSGESIFLAAWLDLVIQIIAKIGLIIKIA
jgi:hypothetical protein